MIGLRIRSTAVFVISTLMLACGGGGETPAISTPNSSNGAGSEIAACDLLTADEVATVLPGSDEGMTVKSGESMIEGVDSYQCSYSNTDFDLLTVIVHVATNNEQFIQIEPKRPMSELYDEIREIEVGDGGWLYGDPTEMQLTAGQGDAVIELELMSVDAGERGDAIVALSEEIAKRID
jgi:hypothetical protein